MYIPELTPEQLDELIQRLKVEQARLMELLEFTKSDAKPVDLDEPIGRLTRMDAIQQQMMTKANRAAYEKKTNQIAVALNAFGRDEYGFCQRCQEPIGYRRLNARPETPFCLACQEKRENFA